MSSLWDQYQARYRKATGSPLLPSTGQLDRWASGEPEVVPLRGFAPKGSRGVVAQQGLDTGNDYVDRELSEARNLEAAAGGVTDERPDENQGFLEGALGFLDRGRAAVTGSITGMVNVAGRGLEAVGVSNPLDEWTAETWNGQTGEDYQPDSLGGEVANSPLGRFWRGLSGAEKYGAGDFDGPMKFSDDDEWWQRALKAGATFTTEVALDPLTYLTFGAGAVGKQAASLGARGVTMATAKELSDDAVRTVASRSGTYRSLREAADAGDDETVFRALAQRTAEPDKVEEATSGLRKRFTSAKDALDDRELAESFASDQFVDELGQAFLGRGGRGVRDYLANNTDLTPEQARKLWDALPREVKGGVRFAVPFTRTSTPALVGDLDNPILDRLGLGRAADLSYAARGAVSTSRPVSAVRGKISGETGEAWSEALRSSYGAARSGNTATSGAYDTWVKLNDARRVQRTADTELGAESSRWLEYAVKGINGLSPEQQESAVEMMGSFFTNPNLTISDTATEVERAAFQGAQTLRDALNRKRDLALAEGITVNEAVDYVPRIMTEEASVARAAEKVGRKRSGGGKSYDPTKAREKFMDVVGQDEDWNLVLRPQTLKEINDWSLEEYGYKLFDDDPLKVAARYMSAMDSLISARRFTNRLRRDGLLIDAGTTTSGVVSRSAVADAAQAAREAAEEADDLAVARRELDELFGPDDGSVAVLTKPDVKTSTERLSDALGDSGGVAGWLRRLPDDPVERQGAVEDLMSAFRDVHRARLDELRAQRATASGKAAERLDRKIELAEKQVADMTVKSLMETTARMSQLGRVLNDSGWDVAGSSAGRRTAPNVNLPGDVGDGTYVNQFARAVVESHFAVRDPDTMTAKVLEFMTPLLGFWKTWATVGRGTGYLSRNLVGGAWNNMLMGVGKANMQDSVKILNARARSAGRLGDDITDPLMEKARLDELMSEELGDERLFALYKAAERQGLFTDTSRVEYMLRNGLSDGSGAQYVMDAAAKKPRVAANYRYRRQAPNDLFFRTQGQRNRAQRLANKSVNNPWVNAMGDASAISEEYLRLSAFIRGAERMASDADPYGLADGGLAAAGLVKAAHFEYSDLSRVEQDGLKFLVPFYVWTRNNVPLQFRALMTQPRYMLAMERAQEGLSNMFGDDSEYGAMMEQYLPNFSRDRMSFVTPWNPTGGGQLALGVESPAIDINRLFAWGDNPVDAFGNTLSRFTEEGVSGVNPLIKAGVEAATGRDSFTGASLEGTVDAPNWARALGLGQEVLGEEEPQVNKRLANFAKDLIPPVGIVENLVPFGQPERNSGRIASSYLSTVGGLPFSTTTPDQIGGQVSRRNDEMRDWLKAAVKDAYPNITEEKWDYYYDLAKSGRYTAEELRGWLERNAT